MSINTRTSTHSSAFNFIVATHASALSGPPHALVRYLKPLANLIILFEFPLGPADLIRPRYQVWQKNRLIDKSSTNLLLKPFILNYLKDWFLCLYWSIKLIRRYSLQSVNFFGCNNLLALAGLFLQKIHLCQKVTFYTIDYSITRFSNPIINQIFHILDRLAARRVTAVWSNTHLVQKIRQSQGVEKSRNYLVPNGVWLKDLSPHNSPNSKFTQPLKLVYHGYLSKGKGLQHLLSALTKTKSRQISLDIIGLGPYKSQLLELTARLNLNHRVTFLGSKSQPECLKLLKNYHLCVHLIEKSEDYHRFCDPLKVKEALGSFLPVMISSLPEVARAVAAKNVGLVIKDVHNPQSIAAHLDQLVKNPEKLAVFRENIAKIRHHFDWQTIYSRALTA